MKHKTLFVRFLHLTDNAFWLKAYICYMKKVVFWWDADFGVAVGALREALVIDLCVARAHYLRYKKL